MSPISNFTEISPVDAAPTHTDRLPDGRMDMTKLSPKRDTSLTKISLLFRPMTQNSDSFMH